MYLNPKKSFGLVRTTTRSQVADPLENEGLPFSYRCRGWGTPHHHRRGWEFEWTWTNQKMRRWFDERTK